MQVKYEPSATWLEVQFKQTNLPRSGLAAYLGVDNAAISRAATGERPLSVDKASRVEAYFSVVPFDAQSEFLRAMRRLRSPEVRAFACATLVDWLRRRAVPPGIGAAGELLVRLERGEANLRADQIVALARSEGLSLAALVDGNAQPEHSPAPGRSIAERIATAARGWARRGAAATYEFALGASSVRVGAVGEAPPASDADTVVLRSAGGRHAVLERCTPYLVPDDSLGPRFEQGETLYLEPSRREIRRGDYVAALLGIEGDRATALIGRMRLETKDTVVIEPPRSGPRELEKSKILSLQRIAFCGL